MELVDAVIGIVSLSLPLLLSIGLIPTAVDDGVISFPAQTLLFDDLSSTAVGDLVIILAVVRNAKRSGAINRCITRVTASAVIVFNDMLF